MGKIEMLQKKQAQIKAQIRAIEARESAKNRKAETRKKILIGAAMLAEVNRGEWPPDKPLLDLLDAALSRPADRALFDLDELKE